MLDQWYAGSTCAVCGKNIGPIDWFKHKPALMRPDRRTVAWNEIPAETLPEVMATHFPVCWDVSARVRAKAPAGGNRSTVSRLPFAR